MSTEQNATGTGSDTGSHPAASNAVTIYVDYGCPFAYRAIEWMYTLAEHSDTPPAVTWRYFSLAQVNYRAKDGWTVWDAPAQDPNWGEQNYARGLRFFWASAASREQGQDAFARFQLALTRAIHAEKREFTSFEPILEVAQGVGLNMDRFIADLANQDLLEQLAVDHRSGAELEVFGVPTFHFDGAVPAYLKLGRVLEPADALQFWQEYRGLIADRPYVVEIKRPQ